MKCIQKCNKILQPKGMPRVASFQTETFKFLIYNKGKCPALSWGNYHFGEKQRNLDPVKGNESLLNRDGSHINTYKGTKWG